MQATIVFEKTWEAIHAKNEDGTRKYKYIIHTGSSRSSKTHSILQTHWLICLSVANTRVSIWRETKADCKMTILSDLKKAVPNFPEYESVVFNKTESIYQFPNGSTIEFMGGDEENRVHGFQGNVAHLNEPYKFSVHTFNQIDMRTSDFVIIDWNPKNKHFIDDVSKRENAIVIHSTYKDNPFVPDQQRIKIESYLSVKFCEVIEKQLIAEKDALTYDFELNKLSFTTRQINELKHAIFNQEQRTADDYMHSVYAKGLKADKPNKIYKGWKAITLEKYNSIKEREYFGLDFGWANPSALVGVKYDGDKSFYIRPALYKSMNSMVGENGVGIPLGEFITAAGFPSGNVTIGWADSSDKEAGSDKSMINDLRTNYKLNIVPTNKPTYKARWEFITKVNIFYVEDDNFEYEYDNYELEYINGAPTGKPIKKDDHCFVGDTLITTDNGDVQIKDIKKGDKVLTSSGYKPVLKKWDNGIINTFEYVLYLDGKSVTLRCTDNHKIKTNIGWIEISKLQSGMMVYLNNFTRGNHLNYNQEKDTSIMDQQECIGMYGKLRQGLKDLKDITYTTLTKTRKTIGSKILNLLKPLNILAIMQEKDLKMILNYLKGFKKQEKKNVEHGTQVKQELNGISNTQLNLISGSNLMGCETANLAIKNMKHSHRTQNSVQENVFQKQEEIQELTMRQEYAKDVQKSSQQVNIVGQKVVAVVVQKKEMHRVYDLTVQGKHEYFANGILVHNCMNALEYCIMGIKKYLKIQI